MRDLTARGLRSAAASVLALALTLASMGAGAASYPVSGEAFLQGDAPTLEERMRAEDDARQQAVRRFLGRKDRTLTSVWRRCGVSTEEVRDIVTFTFAEEELNAGKVLRHGRARIDEPWLQDVLDQCVSGGAARDIVFVMLARKRDPDSGRCQLVSNGSFSAAERNLESGFMQAFNESGFNVRTGAGLEAFSGGAFSRVDSEREFACAGRVDWSGVDIARQMLDVELLGVGLLEVGVPYTEPVSGAMQVDVTLQTQVWNLAGDQALATEADRTVSGRGSSAAAATADAIERAVGDNARALALQVKNTLSRS